MLKEYRGSLRGAVEEYNKTTDLLMKSNYSCERSFLVSHYELKKGSTHYRYFIGCGAESLKTPPKGFKTMKVDKRDFVLTSSKGRELSDVREIYFRAYEHMSQKGGLLIEEYIVKEGLHVRPPLEDVKVNYYFSLEPYEF